MVEHLPLALVLIPEFWDPVWNQILCREAASPLACVSASLSVCLSRTNKILKKKLEDDSQAKEEPYSVKTPRPLLPHQACDLELLKA